jgi:hypothetical protein
MLVARLNGLGGFLDHSHQSEKHVIELHRDDGARTHDGSFIN